MMEYNCTLCHGVGWVLEMNNPISVVVELISCLIPDCSYSGRRLWLISVNEARFTVAVRHPKDKYIMSISRSVNDGY